VEGTDITLELIGCRQKNILDREVDKNCENAIPHLPAGWQNIMLHCLAIHRVIGVQILQSIRPYMTSQGPKQRSIVVFYTANHRLIMSIHCFGLTRDASFSSKKGILPCASSTLTT